MITTANLEKYRNGDFLQFTANVLEILTEDKATALGVATQREALKTQQKAFSEAYIPVLGSDMTPEIQGLDQRRDNAIVGLRMYLEALQYHHDATTKNNAFVLLDVVKRYGSTIQRLRYQLETATINAIINEWEEKNSDKIAQLQIADWVNELKTSNQEFNALYVARTLQLSEVETGVLITVRIAATEAYRLLKQHIEAHALLSPSPAHDQIMAQISSLVTQYNNAVTQYNSQTESGEPETTPENPVVE